MYFLPTPKMLDRLQLCYAPIALSLVISLSVESSANAADAFAETRAKMLQQFDTNGDGVLDATERETMRLDTREKRMKGGSGSSLPADLLADYDTNEDGDLDEEEWNGARIEEQIILTKQYDSNENGTLDTSEQELMMIEIRTVPTRYARDYFAYLLVYDENNSGGFDGSEYQQAQAAETKYFIFTYDADGDGKLGSDEKKKLQSAMKNGGIVGFALRFAPAALGDDKKRTARRGRGGGDVYLQKSQQWLAFDANEDGLASAEELEAIRKSWRQKSLSN